MSNLMDFFGYTVSPPKAVYGAVTGELVSDGSSALLPMAINTDGEYLRAPISALNLTHYDPDGVINWSVTPTDILTAGSGTPKIAGYWWDLSESRLYVLVIEIVSGLPDRAQFAWIDPATGVVTNLNSEFNLTSDAFGVTGALFRNDSGDFTYRSVNDNGLSEMVIPSIGGSATETLDIRFNGRPVSTRITYKTPSGIYAGGFGGYYGRSYMSLAGPRGQVSRTHLGMPAMGGDVNYQSNIIQWGSDIAFVGDYFISGGEQNRLLYGPRLFDKTDFDRFVDEIAKLNGVV